MGLQQPLPNDQGYGLFTIEGVVGGLNPSACGYCSWQHYQNPRAKLWIMFEATIDSFGEPITDVHLKTSFRRLHSCFPQRRWLFLDHLTYPLLSIQMAAQSLTTTLARLCKEDSR